MKPLKYILAGFTFGVVSINTATADISVELDRILQGAQRQPVNTARDIYRHPKSTLMLFDLQKDMDVLEILPGGGWYTEILAPLLKESGTLTVASFGERHPNEYLRNIHIKFIKKMQADTATYGQVKTVLFENSGYLTDIQNDSMDMVLTFRNTHNWIRFGGIEDVYASFYRVLKPGGILGVVQHRANNQDSPKASAEKGYVPEKYLINLIENYGFELVDKSEINANPKDTKNHPDGVWSLPPSLRGKAKDVGKYLSIGESDRMTLKFIKIKDLRN